MIVYIYIWFLACFEGIPQEGSSERSFLRLLDGTASGLDKKKYGQAWSMSFSWISWKHMALRSLFNGLRTASSSAISLTLRGALECFAHVHTCSIRVWMHWAYRYGTFIPLACQAAFMDESQVVIPFFFAPFHPGRASLLMGPGGSSLINSPRVQAVGPGLVRPFSFSLSSGNVWQCVCPES